MQRAGQALVGPTQHLFEHVDPTAGEYSEADISPYFWHNGQYPDSDDYKHLFGRCHRRLAAPHPRPRRPPALPTAAAGLSDWSDTAGAEQRVGALHAGLNLTAVALYTGSWLSRRKTSGAGVMLAVAGVAVMAAAGYLGGHLSYAQGVGIDTNAFQTGPGDWQAVASAADIDDERPYAVSAAGVSLLVVKQAGRVHVLANRCTHRGAPLSDGPVDRGCITCPWHG
ncbi:MAG: Rieske (2Fe-2S) protein, partial [Actinomycetota bacterium]|nr:Rieske (2Fe-2S) protein [Actinomycetota bacterium]